MNLLSYAWLMAQVTARGELKYHTMVNGVQYAMMDGLTTMQELSVDNLGLRLLWAVLEGLVQGMELFGLITLPVLETRQPFLNVVTEDLENIIVTTLKILVSCVQVSQLYVCNTSKITGLVGK